jgi:hypothetical protein
VKSIVNGQPIKIERSVEAPKKAAKQSSEAIEIQAQLNYQMLQEMKNLKKKIKN